VTREMADLAARRTDQERHPALMCEDLSRRYGRRWVVRRVSARFRAGELTVVVGPNGAGKSTLLAMLAGLLRPTEGTITALGERLDGFPRESLRRRLGVLGHQPFVYPELTAAENLTFFAGLYGVRGAAGDRLALLARVGLELAADRPVRTYSRGMVQRLALARLLLQDADLWLLDEPTTGLDTAGRALAVELLAEARARGRCVVCVTHDPELLTPVTDRRLALVEGRAQAGEGAP